jgi:hypothetical protein
MKTHFDNKNLLFLKEAILTNLYEKIKSDKKS